MKRGTVRREVDLGGISRGHILLSNLKEDPRKLVRQIWESRKFSFHKETHLSQQSTKRDLIRGYENKILFENTFFCSSLSYILKLFGEFPKAESGIQICFFFCLRLSLLLCIWPKALRDPTLSVIDTDRIWALIRIT